MFLFDDCYFRSFVRSFFSSRSVLRAILIDVATQLFQSDRVCEWLLRFINPSVHLLQSRRKVNLCKFRLGRFFFVLLHVCGHLRFSSHCHKHVPMFTQWFDKRHFVSMDLSCYCFGYATILLVYASSLFFDDISLRCNVRMDIVLFALGHMTWSRTMLYKLLSNFNITIKWGVKWCSFFGRVKQKTNRILRN